MTKQVREWQEDMKMCEKASPEPWRVEQLEYMGNRGMVQETVIDGVTSEIYNEEDARFIAEAREALPYWLQQYAAEKARGDKLDQRNIVLLGANQMYQVDLAECLGREKKLREAIEDRIRGCITIADYNHADALEKLLASLYPKEEEAK